MRRIQVSISSVSFFFSLRFDIGLNWAKTKYPTFLSLWVFFSSSQSSRSYSASQSPSLYSYLTIQTLPTSHHLFLFRTCYLPCSSLPLSLLFKISLIKSRRTFSVSIADDHDIDNDDLNAELICFIYLETWRLSIVILSLTISLCEFLPARILPPTFYYSCRSVLSESFVILHVCATLIFSFRLY